MMFKKIILSIFYDRRKLIIIFLFLFVVCIDALLVFKDSFLYESIIHSEFHYPLEVVYQGTIQPFIAAFLSGSSRGHIPQEMIIWFLPVFCLFIHADNYVFEKKLNYQNLIFVRLSKKKLFFLECISSYMIMFLLSFVSLGLNFIICYLLFKNGQATYYSTTLQNINPFLVYFIYFIVFCNIAGILSSSLKALSYAFPNSIILYSTGLGLWFLQISSPYSITYVMQPFIEYGLDYMIPSLLIFLFISLIYFILGYYKITHDED